MVSASVDKVISGASGIYQNLEVLLSIVMNEEDSDELGNDFYNNMFYFVSNLFSGKMTLKKLKFMNYLFKMNLESLEALAKYIPEIISVSENIDIPTYFKTIVNYDLKSNKTTSETFILILRAFGVVANKANDRNEKGRSFIKRYTQSLEAYRKYQISLLPMNNLP